MFCPVCRDEYRAGFTRCATCDVALVDSLTATTPPKPASVVFAESAADEPMVNYCGFLTLEEARQAREKLRDANLSSEILIRDAPRDEQTAPVQEEFWLRVKPSAYRATVALLGFEPATAASDDSFRCSSCGATAQASDDACPGCGLRFET